jgi:alkanesulfonate monooxygenase SsuD/methylene tetrahydromethanopterin reductase-like flavin-dependent oxidoreductase (luciferase family)
VVRVLGRKPTTLRQLEEAMRVIKDLAEGREADYGGVNVKIPWVEDGKLDVWMAGYGPKALSLVGRKADGFILQLADPVILEWTMKHVHDAAREAAATRRRSRSAWPPPPTSAATSPTSATSAGGSGGWSATTSPTSSPATARTARSRTPLPTT